MVGVLSSDSVESWRACETEVMMIRCSLSTSISTFSGFIERIHWIGRLIRKLPPCLNIDL